MGWLRHRDDKADDYVRTMVVFGIAVGVVMGVFLGVVIAVIPYVRGGR